jgi:hypothetical protein
MPNHHMQLTILQILLDAIGISTLLFLIVDRTLLLMHTLQYLLLSITLERQ